LITRKHMDKLSGFLSAYERVIALLADGVTERSETVPKAR
jgi:hypothetical protein